MSADIGTLDIYCAALYRIPWNVVLDIWEILDTISPRKQSSCSLGNGNKTKLSAVQSTRSLVHSLENVLWVEVSSMRAFSQVHPTPFVSVVPCLSSVSLLVWSSKISVFQVVTDSQVFVVDGSLHSNFELSKANFRQMKTRAHRRTDRKKILPNMIVKW